MIFSQLPVPGEDTQNTIVLNDDSSDEESLSAFQERPSYLDLYTYCSN